MPDTRFTLLGKICVWAVKASDSDLRSALKKGGWKGIINGKRNKTKRNSSSIKKRKLTAGVHQVVINGTKRKVRVLSNGIWRFMKNGRS